MEKRRRLSFVFVSAQTQGGNKYNHYKLLSSILRTHLKKLFQVEAPLCASPGHLTGLKVARLRLGQLVSSENIQNRGRDIYLLHTGLPTLPGSILAKCALGVSQVKRLPRLHCRLRPSSTGEKPQSWGLGNKHSINYQEFKSIKWDGDVKI